MRGDKGSENMDVAKFFLEHPDRAQWAGAWKQLKNDYQRSGLRHSFYETRINFQFSKKKINPKGKFPEEGQRFEVSSSSDFKS